MSTEEQRPHAHSDDESLLHRLGYAQELFRGMGGFQNFAISFTIISILAGCLTSYSVGMEHGGPILDHLGLAPRRPHVDDHLAGDGRDRLGVSDRGRPLLLGVQARESRLGLGDGLVQPDRPGSRHGGDRIRPRDLRGRPARLLVRLLPADERHFRRLGQRVVPTCSTRSSCSAPASSTSSTSGSRRA